MSSTSVWSSSPRPPGGRRAACAGTRTGRTSRPQSREREGRRGAWCGPVIGPDPSSGSRRRGHRQRERIRESGRSLTRTVAARPGSARRHGASSPHGREPIRVHGPFVDVRMSRRARGTRRDGARRGRGGPGSGVRGTVDLSWGDISGGPITARSGSAHLTFDPSAAGRQETLAAIFDPRLGEPSRPPYAPQVQAARVTSLVSDKTETVTCLGDDGEGNPIEYPAPWSSSIASSRTGRCLRDTCPTPRPVHGTRRRRAGPVPAPSSSGWWAADRFALPGRFTRGRRVACPGDGAAADRLPRILALNGQGAVPRPLTDWLDDDSRSLHWPVRRTRSGWRATDLDR